MQIQVSPLSVHHSFISVVFIFHYILFYFPSTKQQVVVTAKRVPLVRCSGIRPISVEMLKKNMFLLLVLIHFDREWCLQLKTHLINFIQLRMAPEDWVGPDGNISLSPGCERAIAEIVKVWSLRHLLLQLDLNC